MVDRLMPLLVVLAVGSVPACGDDGGGDGGVRCTSGAVEECVLPDGAPGERRCGTDFRWGACVPPGTMPPDDYGPVIDWLAEGSPPIVPPTFGPCPPGWRTIPDPDAEMLCDPWPETGHEDCAVHEVHLPGSDGCAPVAGPCPADGWPLELPTDSPILYVDDDAPSGGDGRSRASALADLTTALSVASPGTTVALATGTYTQPVRDSLRGVDLVGACHETYLSSADLGLFAIEPGTESTVRNLSIRDVAAPFYVGGTLTLAGVVFTEIEGGVAAIDSGTLIGRDLAVSRITAIRDDDQPFMLFGGASLDIRGASFGNLEGGIAAMGIEVPDGEPPVQHVRLSDVVLFEADSSGPGAAITSYGPADLVVERFVSLAQDPVVLVTDSQTTLRDFVVTPAGPPMGAYAMVDGSGGATRLERSYLAGLLGDAVTTVDGVLTLEDVLIRDLSPMERGGTAIFAVGADHVQLDRTVIRNAANGGLMVVLADSATVSNVLIDGASDLGATFHFVGELVLRSSSIEVDTGSAVDVAVADGESVLSDLRLAGNEVFRDSSGEEFASNLYLIGSGGVRLERLLLEGAPVLGLATDGPTVTASDILVRDTPTATCAATDCTQWGGFGLTVTHDGHLSVDRFRVEEAGLCGVLVGAGSQMDLSEGIVQSAPIGACVQADGYDVSRLSVRVAYRDVETTLQSTSLPVPTPPSELVDRSR